MISSLRVWTALVALNLVAAGVLLGVPGVAVGHGGPFDGPPFGADDDRGPPFNVPPDDAPPFNVPPDDRPPFDDDDGPEERGDDDEHDGEDEEDGR